MITVVVNQQMIASIREGEDLTVRMKVRETLNKWHNDVRFDWQRDEGGGKTGSVWRAISTHELEIKELNEFIEYIDKNIPKEYCVWLHPKFDEGF